MNSGSLLSSRVCVKCGLRPYARQIREMAVWLILVVAAADRADQCARLRTSRYQSRRQLLTRRSLGCPERWGQIKEELLPRRH